MQKQFQTTVLNLLDSPYVLWVVVNVVIWSLALYTVALSIRLLGIVGAPIGTALAGLIVGTGQAWTLRHIVPIEPKRWTTHSVVGAVLGVLPIALLFLWIVLVAVIGVNSVLFILGGLFGGILGATQSRVLYPIVHEQIGWWIGGNVLAGALCAPLSLMGGTFWLPVFCSLGPLTFGLLTAVALRYAMRAWDDELT